MVIYEREIARLLQEQREGDQKVSEDDRCKAMYRWKLVFLLAMFLSVCATLVEPVKIFWGLVVPPYPLVQGCVIDPHVTPPTGNPGLLY